MCVDNRKLNAITLGDTYPIPHIDKLNDGIGVSKYIIILYLTKGTTKSQ